MKPKTIASILFLITSTFLLATDAKKSVLPNNVLFNNMQSNYVKNYLLNTSYYVPAKKEKISDFKRKEIEESILKQPIKFIENKGQMVNTEGKPVPFVLFKAESYGMNVYITETGLTYVFVKMKEDEKEEQEREAKKKKETFNKHEEQVSCEMAWINVSLEGASIKRENIIKEKQSTEHFNYFYGHCPDGIYDVYQYEKITIKDVYPNIDWLFYNSSKGGMKYDFIVHPGADPKQIKLIYDSEKPLSIDNNGNINVKTKLGTLTEKAPYSYIKETNTEVKSSFTKTQLNKHKVEVTFNIDSMHYNNTLVIDPQLVWGTLYGGNIYDGSWSMTSDLNNNIYIVGYTGSTNFPTVNFSGSYYSSSHSGGAYDSFILKFNASNVLEWSTYYGGSDKEEAISVKTDNLNNLYVVGYTMSSDFPLKIFGGAFMQNIFGGGGYDAFLLKFNNFGVRQWATFYGGTGQDIAKSITIDNLNNIYISGLTQSIDLPLQSLIGAYNQSIYRGGNDVFILKFNSSGIRTWCTYFSGTADEEGLALTTDNLNNLYITGYTNSTDFPIQFLGGAYNQSVNGGYWDAFLLKFNNSNSLVYSSYVGGDSWDWGQSITIDNSNNVFIAGDTESSNFPVKFLVGAYNQSINGGIEDVFICKFNTSNQIIWATYYGGSNREFFLSYDNLEVDNCDNIFLSFSTIGDDSPTTSSTPTTHSNFGFDDNIACITNGYAMTYDNFIVKFSDNGGVLWDSYIGGDGNDFRTPIEIDTFNNLYVSGEWTSITNESSYPFQNQSGSYFNSTFNGYDDGYILKFKPTLAINQFQVNDENCNCTGTASVSIANGDIPYSYIWSNGVTLLNTTNTISTISGLCSGVYQVTVTSSCNQSQVMSYSITSGGMPLANISANPIIGENPLVVNYTNSSSGGTSYLWDFGNGNNANTYDVLSQTYITPGTYIVYYTTLNGSCSSKDSLIITVTDGNILIPNVFTPNGDGANDVFKVSSQFIKEFNCTIYNRWGNKLFEWSDIKTGWDGKVNNKESADGTYFYIINAKKIDGKEFKKEGAFTLIR